ncbi:MAG: ABC transporter permease [Chloroflexi bacterium]|nr:ABC transporter permease [Chloroflexota bacterium]
MLRYVTVRIVQMIPVLFLVSLASFALTYVLPGDPALAIIGEQNARDPILYAQLRQDMGLDRPLLVQYFDWAGRLLRGDLGISTSTRQPVSTLLGQRLWPTLQLGTLGMALSLVIAIPIGIMSATRPGSKLDLIGTVASMVATCIPHFWLGLLLILLFGLYLRWLPPSGYISPSEDLLGNLRLMIMPTLVVSGGTAAVMMRQVRSSMLEILGREYITTARAKGLKSSGVVIGHALKNALIPVLTVIGLQLGVLIGGAVVTESVFSIPGIGRLAADSIFNRDFPVLQAIVLVMAFAVLLANLFTDIAYAWLDPRIRYQ